MPDREKVIKGLECCKRKDGNECKICPYTESEYCTEDMVTDVLTLLKEQEVVVRCKDCKHYSDPEATGFGVCMKIMHGCQSWGFCADGEKYEGVEK